MHFLLAALLMATRHRAVEHQARVATVQRIVVVILENADASVAETLPFITRLAARGAILRNDRCIGHPSQPNYIAAVSGSTQGVTGDAPVTIDAPHVGDLVEQRGLTWKTYAEKYPGGCYLGATFDTVADGQYVRRHVPFLSFVDIQQNFDRCVTHIVNAARFDDDLAASALPALSFYIPDDIHNGHDSGPLAADAWLQSRFGPLLDDPRLMDGTLFIVTYDESISMADLRVTTVLVGSMVRAGFASLDPYDHYDLLRTIENLLGLGTLGRLDAAARPIAGVWR